ncbi:PAS domain-containing sensor histidine kinase [Aliidiomarina taiwanensis]|uniref:histidine kinase n=2 Tax=Aliidiomarina taiwanensis TaxID=946228 RepID=A0A432WZ82_9GAMM|nr:PAS domain-containing sensor histidine kinase [Aliidiomarina taiwanensis]
MQTPSRERVGVHVRSLVQAMPNGVVLLDARGYVREANREAIRLLEEPLEGELWRAVIERAFRPQADDGHEVSLRSGRRVRLDISSLAPEPGQLIVLTDLSETRALLERISHLQRLTAMGRMVASLAHQVRTPLSAALLYAENLERGDLSGPQQKRFAGRLTARLKDLEQQVNDMLLYAKSGEQQPVSKVSLNDILNSLKDQIEPLAERENVTVCIENNVEHGSVLGNLNALTGALQNLVINAIQASKAGDRVLVQLEQQKDTLYVQVKDTGTGISKSDLEQVFMPFFTRKSHGTGLGLAVVKTVMKAHQGHIEVESKEGEGTRFTIQLPLANSSAFHSDQEVCYESS